MSETLTVDNMGQSNGLDAALNQSEQTLDIALETLEQTFSRRAAQLAKLPEAESESERTPLALFWLGQEVYGVEAQYVIEIRPAIQVTKIPRVPNWVAGVVNLRGRILSLVKLHPYFGISTGEHQSNGDAGHTESLPYLVVVETKDMEIALLVDAIITVDNFVADRIRDVSDNVRGIPKEYVLGVLDYESEDLANAENKTMPVAILDLPTLLADEKLIIREEIA